MQKTEIRDYLAADINRFLEAGGQIETVPAKEPSKRRKPLRLMKNEREAAYRQFLVEIRGK